MAHPVREQLPVSPQLRRDIRNHVCSGFDDEALLDPRWRIARGR